MRSLTIFANNTVDLEKELSVLVNDTFRPILAIVFTAPSHNSEAISAIFTQLKINVFGCTTAGEIHNNQLSEGGISVLLLEIDKKYFDIKLIENTDGITKTAFDLAMHSKAAFEQPALLVLSAGLKNDGEEIVYGLKSIIKDEFPVFGGLAGDNLQMKDTFIFSNYKHCSNGLIGITFDNKKIELQGLAESGWAAVGPEHLVTSAENNVLYEINNQPALEVFTRYFGYFDNIDTGKNLISTMSAQYPLQVKRGEDYTVLRAPMSANEEDGSLMLVGAVHNGDKFRFSMAPGFEIIDNTIEKFQSWGQNQTQPDALILFSCKGRHAALGPLLENEIEGIYKKWKKPMVGFLSYGEIGNLEGKTCDFHNETCCLITIKERVSS
jgi:hypothetical protein